MKRHVLITGGAGFIGSQVALRLVAQGHRVRVIDNLSRQIHGVSPESSPPFQAIRDKVEFIRGSVTNLDELMQALQNTDTVVHMAAETGTGQSMHAIRHYSDVNIGGTALLLDLIANEPLPVKKIVVASSRAVYGEGKYLCKTHYHVYPRSRAASDMENGNFAVRCPFCSEPAELEATDEETSVRPASIYGITKLAQEEMVLTVGKALGISAVALRYQNVYGPGQSLSNPYTGILSIFSTRILNGNSINIFEDGKESRDFVYIDDVVAATVKSVEHEAPIRDVFNVGSGVATDVYTIAQMLQQMLGRRVPTVVSGQFRLGDIRHNLADLTKVRLVLGWSPHVSIHEGLARFVEWVKGERVEKDRYDESLQELRSKGLFR